MNNSINTMLNDLMRNIDLVSETKKVIGDAITMEDGTIIIPVSKVSMGFGGGGSEFGKSEKTNVGGGMAGGVKVSPEAFLVVNSGNVRLIPMNGGSTPLDKAIDLVPGLIDKLNNFISLRNTKNEGEEN